MASYEERMGQFIQGNGVMVGAMVMALSSSLVGSLRVNGLAAKFMGMARFISRMTTFSKACTLEARNVGVVHIAGQMARKRLATTWRGARTAGTNGDMAQRSGTCCTTEVRF